MGLLHNERNLIIILGCKQHFGARIDNLGQLRAKIGVLGGKAFKGHHRAGAVIFLPSLFEKLGQPFGVVAGDIIKYRRFFKTKFITNEIGSHRSLERIEKTAAEHVRTILGGIGVGRPGADHRRAEFIGFATGRYGLLG